MAGAPADPAAPEAEMSRHEPSQPGGADDSLANGVWRVHGAPLIAAPAPGALTGHTVAVKDLYAVAGFAVGAGVREYLGDPEPRHAYVVAALLGAGADIAGIAHTDEFAYSITGANGGYGMPVNPAAPQRIPGGSSSGSAVAVARGEARIGLGTDTAGSIRVPAAYQGLWGIRTTHARISTRGVLPLAPSFDTVGWIAADPHTLAAVAECLIPAAQRPALSNPARPIVDRMLCEVADPALAAATLAVAETVEANPVDLETELETWFTAFRTVQAHEAWATHGDWIRAHPGALSPEVAQRFSFAAGITAAAAGAGRRVLSDAATHLRTALAGRMLLLPTTATQPPDRDADPAELEAGRTRTLHLTCLASLAGLPAVTFPLAPVDGIPTGLCLLGAPDTDHALIDMARHLAAAI
ncbi:amidase family protein [Nocardia sp. NBC_01503]|uniref:amidase family protein n=1 Tax=Nocardia sp. NBC_01503 TaxID=2975997 RepID=UPI002E7C1995|nr:amidase family protein [Nocardia sp. NBC_01503]WTL30298.1 amidase family protein [Nocardia sp. NBC_01503]